MRILENGQYLGETFRSFENNDFTLKNSLHNKSKSDCHIHKNAYLSILLSGSYIETTKNSSHRMLPGNIVFRPAHYPHQNIFETDNIKCLNITLKDEWLRRKELQLENKPYQLDQINQFPYLFQLITDFLRSDKLDLAEEIIIDLFNYRAIKTETSKRLPWIDKLKIILDHEIIDTHSLKSLAERIHVHPNYMARIFKQRFGVSIGQYQVNNKLTSATALLLNGNKHIAAIGNETGFFDEAHFIRTFKAKYGITPHQFRLTINS